MVELEFKAKTQELIDSLKSICANYGLGNDGNEFKIITQIFLYKFLNDKFAYEAKKIDEDIAKVDNWEKSLSDMSEEDYEMLQLQMSADTARLEPQHFISYLFSQSNAPDFAKLFDDTLIDIAIKNNDIFAVKTDGGAKVVLFDRLSQYIADESKRDDFCRAVINKLIEFSFERIFDQKFDFYAGIFEYLIKDYNSNSGGKYAEYLPARGNYREGLYFLSVPLCRQCANQGEWERTLKFNILPWHICSLPLSKADRNKLWKAEKNILKINNMSGQQLFELLVDIN